MRIAIVSDYNVNASSLMNIARHVFRELGFMMNTTNSFTVSLIRESQIGIGDINQHYDIIHYPNVGGMRFPLISAQKCNNLIIGLSGIDELIYGKEVFADKQMWARQEPIIKENQKYWQDLGHKVNKVYVTTNSELNEMHQYLKIPKDKMIIIPHGVDHSLFNPSADKKKLQSHLFTRFELKHKPYFLHVGESNWARKNQPRILEAFQKAKLEKIPHQLIIIGKYKPEIFEIAKNIKDVKLLGWVSNQDLIKFMQAADAFVLPSIHEGFGMPLVESMACGVPCITSITHAPPEVIGNSGILVDPHDSSEISRAIVSMAKSIELRKKLSNISLEQSKKFSWIETTKKIFNLYEINPQITMKNFESSYETAALRTLTTVCELYPDHRQNLIMSLLKFDFSSLINWALHIGLYDEKTKDFLIPFKDWLEHKSYSG
jgi:glycosyltransferase involved in cell wall biosynthesis